MLTPTDLAPFADIPDTKAQAMIDDATAMATLVAPCLASDSGVTLSASQEGTVRAVLRRAVLRWNEVGTGAVSQSTSGPFSQSVDTTRVASKSLFWPSEIADLQAVCRAASETPTDTRAVFTIATGRRGTAYHSPICDLYFGGTTCSCGSSLNNFMGPLYEFGEVMP